MELGVVVGRFQSPHLTKGHHSLLSQVSLISDKILIIVGSTVTKGMQRNPLDSQTVHHMLNEQYPEAMLYSIDDFPDNDYYWSQTLDDIVLTFTGEEDKVTLYGGRDSFLPHYKGAFETLELTSIESESGTEARIRLETKFPVTEQGRAGVIYAAYNKWPNPLFCVDVAVFNVENNDLLAMGKKVGEDKWRLPGGFIDNADINVEQAVARELFEETNLNIQSYRYRGSFTIDDARYRRSEVTLKTLLFSGQSGNPDNIEAGDDLAVCEWVEYKKLNLEEDVVPDHIKLLNELTND